MIESFIVYSDSAILNRLSEYSSQSANHCALFWVWECVRKQPIIALYFESETVLKFYNQEACVLKAMFSSIVLTRENIYNNYR